MILKLNTSICPIVDIGTYHTALSPDHIFDSERYEWEEALKEGRITEEELGQLNEAACRGFNFKKYLDELGKHALDEIEDFFKGIEQYVKVALVRKGYSTYIPKEYNFSTDGMEYCIEVGQNEINRLAGELMGNTEFIRWIFDTYKSRSGFISFMPYNACKVVLLMAAISISSASAL